MSLRLINLSLLNIRLPVRLGVACFQQPRLISYDDLSNPKHGQWSVRHASSVLGKGGHEVGLEVDEGNKCYFS